MRALTIALTMALLAPTTALAAHRSAGKSKVVIVDNGKHKSHRPKKPPTKAY